MSIYLLYARVSTEDQARQGFSLPEQIRSCRMRAQQLATDLNDSAPVLIEFADELSGDMLERPGLQAALELVRAKQARVMVCLDPDRLARRLMHQLLLTDEIEAGGCRLEFVDHEYRRDPEGKLFYQMRGAIAEYEKAKILQRMSRGALGKARAGGVPTYICPYGYTFRVGLGHAAAAEVIQPSPEEAEWVQTMFRWCAEEGLGPRTIAARLNALGIPAKRGGAWSEHVVRRILRNPTYATGSLLWGTKDHRGINANRSVPKGERRRRGLTLTPVLRPGAGLVLKIAPIIDEDVYARVQEVLAGFRVGGRAANDPRRQRLLTSLGRCGDCGGHLMYYSGRKLTCRGRLEGNECRLPSKPAAAIEAAVWAEVVRWCETGAMQVAAQRRTPRLPQRSVRKEIEALKVLAEQKRSAVERWGRLYAEGRVPDDVALPAIEAARAEWAQADERARALMEPPVDLAKDRRLDSWPDLVVSATTPEALGQLTDDQRIALVHALVASFTVSPSPRRAPPIVHVRAVWDDLDSDGERPKRKPRKA